MLCNFRRRLQKTAQRGYNLVEIGIVLAVVGLLLGGSLIPLGALNQEDQNQRETDKMEIFHDAILGYALAHRTAGRTVVVRASRFNQREIPIPAGRPYLPCPDVTGDGYEDRGYTRALGLRIPEGAVTIFADTNVNELLVTGNCLSTRGVLPWRTLGVPPADSWGNRYTYEVDDVFSNALVGFGQDSDIDQFDVRLTVIPVRGNEGQDSYRKRRTNVEVLLGDDTSVGDEGGPYFYRNRRQPIIICTADATDSADICETNRFVFADGGGTIAATAFNAPRKAFGVNDVTEGLPYVIVSHGKNGHGAVNHAATAENDDNFAMFCNSPMDATNSGAGAVRIDNSLLAEAFNFPTVESAIPSELRYCHYANRSGTGLAYGRFFIQPRVADTFAGSGVVLASFDDILSWRTRRELLKQMTASGVLPVEEFPAMRGY